MVWEEFDGTDNEIYLYKGYGDPIQLTDNNYFDGFPQINDRGWVTWQGNAGGADSEIFLW